MKYTGILFLFLNNSKEKFIIHVVCLMFFEFLFTISQNYEFIEVDVYHIFFFIRKKNLPWSIC